MCTRSRSLDPTRKEERGVNSLASAANRRWEPNGVYKRAHQSRSTYITAATILARVAVALAGLDLAVGAAEAGLAGAGVAALACVGASGVVLAWLVVGTEVQVLVAEEATPTFLAIALPWLVAGAVQAAWVALALITEGALPPEAALALSGGVTITVLFAAARQADGC